MTTTRLHVRIIEFAGRILFLTDDNLPDSGQLEAAGDERERLEASFRGS